MHLFMDWIKSLMAERGAETSGPASEPTSEQKPDKYAEARRQEWRKVSHRGTETATDMALFLIGCFTCSGCRTSFMGTPAVVSVDSQGMFYEAKCHGCHAPATQSSGKGW